MSSSLSSRAWTCPSCCKEFPYGKRHNVDNCYALEKSKRTTREAADEFELQVARIINATSKARRADTEKMISAMKEKGKTDS